MQDFLYLKIDELRMFGLFVKLSKENVTDGEGKSWELQCLFAWQQPHLPHSQTISGTLQAFLRFCSFVSPALSVWLQYVALYLTA